MRLLFVIILQLYGIVHTVNGQGSKQGLVKVLKEKDLRLDFETAYPSYFGTTIQYCSDTDEIIYLNQITQSLKFFDYKTGQFKRSLKLRMEGPNGVGPEVSYVHYHNKDSLFVKSGKRTFDIFLLDGKGEVVNSFNYGGFEYSEYLNKPIPYTARQFGAMVIDKGDIILALEVPDNKKQMTKAPVLKINMRTLEVKYFSSPIPYQGLNVNHIPDRRNFEFYSSRLTLNRKMERLFINFPLEKELYMLSSDNTVTRIGLETGLMGDFKFLEKDRGSYDQGDLALSDVIFNSAWYYGIIYNQYNDLYYRIGRPEGDSGLYRRKKSEGNAGKIPYKYVISIYDSSFKLLGEDVFTTKDFIVHRGAFVAPDGLWVLQPNTKGEDILGLALIGLSDD